jgi:outer membrane cobalamin receptor
MNLNYKRYDMRLLIFIFLIIINTTVFGQTISGYVLDEASGEPLISATIFEKNNQKGSTTNEYGFFSITLPKGEVQLNISYVGYESIFYGFDLKKDTNLIFTLKTVNLQEIIITENQIDKITARTTISAINLPIEQIKTLPMLGGEPDVLKALTLMPGVSSGSEGSTGLFVRGGTPDQNLILLDGATVYNASHLFGFLSVFNTDALKNIEIYKGGFPARYGGRLSSVLDITMKEGNNQEWSGKIGIGLIASNFLLEGPIKKDKSSFLLTARTSYLDAFTFWNKQNFDAGSSEKYTNYNLYDINAKFNHQFSNKQHLYFSFYHGKDFLNSKTRNNPNELSISQLKWGNTTFSARFNQKITNKLFAKFMAYYTHYNYQLKQNEQSNLLVDSLFYKQTFTNQSTVNDIGTKINLDYSPNPNHQIKFGIEAVRHFYTPQNNQFQGKNNTDSISFSNRYDYQSNEFGAYFEDKMNIRDNLSLNIGGRLAGFQVQKSFYTALEPRLIVGYELPNEYILKAAYTRTKQFIHLLTNNGIGLPNDIWVNSTDNIKPQKADMCIIGISKTFRKFGVETSIEGYYKKMSNLIDYKQGIDFLSSFSEKWEDIVEPNGKGEAYGTEFFIHKKQGKINGWVGYTLSWNFRQFDNLNNGNSYPFKYDRRHDLSIVTNYHFNKKWTVSAVWVFATGNATTLPQAKYDINHATNYPSPFRSYIFSYPDRNSSRMPNYHRGDISFTHKKETKKGRLRTLNFSVYNVYNRYNPNYLIIRNNGEWNTQTLKFDNPRTEMAQVSLLPFLPSVYYSLTF